jgi:hypothetical protein
MNAPDTLTIILILFFAGLFLFAIFLLLKQKSKSVLDNRLLVPGVIVLLIVVFVFIRRPIVSYYHAAFKEAPYDFSELKSIVFKYGEGDSLVNQYDSGSGEYQYLNRKDSLVKTHLYLTTNDLLYLHHKAAELGYWDFPSNEKTSDTLSIHGLKPVVFLIEFNYKHNSKKVFFSSSYNGPQKLVEANQQLITEIQNVLRTAEDRKKN